MITADEAVALADEDPKFRKLIEQLPEIWASMPADGSQEEGVMAHLRAAYGVGYVTALTEAR